MKNKAFTLAEVLIAICIIGIVAALTLPSLMRLHKDAGTGPLLAKVSTTIEDAVTRMLIEDPELSLTDTDVNTPAKLVAKLDDFLIMKSTTIGNTSWYRLKDGTCIRFAAASSVSGATFTDATGGCYMLVYVDINGSATPNVAGVDQFEFILTKKGLMFGYGSSAIGMTNTCTKDSQNYSCTGRIADNSWKIDY